MPCGLRGSRTDRKGLWLCQAVQHTGVISCKTAHCDCDKRQNSNKKNATCHFSIVYKKKSCAMSDEL
jgi:hypothetical protein